MNRIYVLGMPGAGKSSVSIGLANKLQWNLFDLDSEIEKRYGSIEEIFKSQGEQNFRLYERELLMETLFLNNVVVACGGGAPCFFDQLNWMNWNGITLYLQRDTNSICAIMQENKMLRPMFLGLDEAQMALKMKELLLKRQVFYNKSKIIYGNNQHFENDLSFDIEYVRRMMENHIV